MTLPRLPLSFLLAASVCASCAEAPPPGRVERVQVVIGDFLTDASLREVELERSDSPVVARTAGPRPKVRGVQGVLPALVAAPPARVQLEIPPELPPGALLRISAGFDKDAYSAPAAGGKVRFRISLDGEVQGGALLPFGSEVLPAKRAWKESEHSLAGVRRVTLETELDGSPDQLVEAAWGLVQIVAPKEVRRQPASPERPNIVLVVIDTLRADRLGCDGYEKPTSPRIDALAARGVRFARAFATAAWTWPSTASILTSLTPPAHGLDLAESCFLAHELETLPESLLRAGLHTAGFSANPLVSATYNFHQGFEHFSEYGFVPAAAVLPDVESWLRAHSAERFFLYLHITDPHAPYEPDAKTAGDLIGVEPEDYDQGVAGQIFGQRVRGQPFDLHRLERHIAYASTLYDGEVRASDRAVGRVLDLLDALGLTDRTVVALTADHGEEFLDHGFEGHSKQVYDEVMRVPLVLAGPGVPVGAVEETTVENRYLPQTLLHLGRIEGGRFLEPSHLLDARSLSRFADEALFASTPSGRWLDEHGVEVGLVGPIYGVRRGQRALHWAPRGEGPADDCVRYFELDSDPRMLRDLSSERPEEIAAFQRLILDWLASESAASPGGLSGGGGTIEMLRDLGYVDGE